jgi:hypothetical protein
MLCHSGAEDHQHLRWTWIQGSTQGRASPTLRRPGMTCSDGLRIDRYNQFHGIAALAAGGDGRMTERINCSITQPPALPSKFSAPGPAPISLNGLIVAIIFGLLTPWEDFYVAAVFRRPNSDNGAGVSCWCTGCGCAYPKAARPCSDINRSFGSLRSSSSCGPSRNHPRTNLRWLRGTTDSRSPHGSVSWTGGYRSLSDRLSVCPSN